MAALSATDRDRVKAFYLRQGEDVGEKVFLKPELVAAIAATDDWIDANTSMYNSALPTEFRTKATLAQKTMLFCWVAMRRSGLLHVEEDG